MSLIDGIGGVFLSSENPERLAEWYQETFAVDFVASPDCAAFYKTFDKTTWAILRFDDPGAGKINYRVKNLAEVVASLERKGVAIEKKEDYAYGSFAYLTDPEGNRIELFEENDSAAAEKENP